MKDLKIGKKLGISFIILLMITAFSSFYVLLNLKKASKQSHELLKGPYKVTDKSMAIRRDIVSIDQNVMNSIAGNKPKEHEISVQKDFNSIDKSIKVLRANSIGDKKLIDDIEKSIANLKQQNGQIYKFIDKGDNKSAEQLVITEGSGYYQVYVESVSNSRAIYEDEMSRGIRFDKEIENTTSTAMITYTIICVASILAGIFICMYIKKSLKKPIEEIEIAVNKMAVGDYNINIEYESKDELGSLSDSMRKMTSKTKDIINDTVRVLGEVALVNFNIEPKVEYI